MVRAAIEHTLGEISRRWELLKRIYTCFSSVVLLCCATRRDFKNTSTWSRGTREILKRTFQFVTKMKKKTNQNLNAVIPRKNGGLFFISQSRKSPFSSKRNEYGDNYSFFVLI